RQQERESNASTSTSTQQFLSGQRKTEATLQQAARHVEITFLPNFYWQASHSSATTFCFFDNPKINDERMWMRSLFPRMP
ncbi:hypothetical protein ABTM44_18640, partial [Acinetobacter baumannii]